MCSTRRLAETNVTPSANILLCCKRVDLLIFYLLFTTTNIIALYPLIPTRDFSVEQLSFLLPNAQLEKRLIRIILVNPTQISTPKG